MVGMCRGTVRRRIVAACHTDRFGPSRLSGLYVPGRIPHDEDLLGGETSAEARGLFDRQFRQLRSIGGVRAVGPEDEEAIEVRRYQLRAGRSLHGARNEAE